MRYAIAALLALAWLPAAAPAANVYRSVDAQGHVRYSDTPSPGAQLISVDSASSDQPVTPVSTAADKTPADPAAQADAQIAQQQAQRAVQQDVARQRAQQCQQARAAYEKSIQARRIYKTGANGEREYLSDVEADQMRTSQRLEMESLCGSAQ